MAIVTRTTTTRTTTTAGGGGSRAFHVIPLWTVKLITAILSIVVLVLVFIQPRNMWHSHVVTFITIILTTGFLLGWSFPAVLNRFLSFHRVDAVLHTVLATLAALSLAVCVVYLIDNKDYSRSESYHIMIGIAVCVGIETVICCVLVFWICCGNYSIIENH